MTEHETAPMSLVERLEAEAAEAEAKATSETADGVLRPSPADGVLRPSPADGVLRPSPADEVLRPQVGLRDGRLRPPRGRLFAADPILQHEYRGRFATGWLGRLGWLFAAILLFLLVSVVIGVVVALFVLGIHALAGGSTPWYEPGEEIFQLAIGNSTGFVMLAITGIGFAIPTLVISRVLYRRWWYALTYDAPFRGYDFVKAGAAYSVLMLASYGLIWLTASDHISATSILTDPPPGYGIWLGIGLLIVLIQSFGEEFLFRGLMPRLLGVVIPYRLIVVGITISIFLSLHATNSDVAQDMIFIFIGFAAMEVLSFTVLFRTRSIAGTWAIHWVNNSFLLLLISTESGGMSSMTPLAYTDPVWSAGGSYLMEPSAYIALGVKMVLLCLMLFWKRSPFYLPWHDERASESETPHLGDACV